ncbi:MAG: membrane protein insertase YidC [Pseudomonadota bacterium]
MELWTMWIEFIHVLIIGLSGNVGFGLGIAIIATTILFRLLLLPISWPIGYRACIRQKKLRKLQPQLQRLREAYSAKPELYMQQMKSLYKRHNLKLFDGLGLLGGLLQIPVFLGMFHVLKGFGEGIRFLWVTNLAKPDFWFAIIAGITTALMMMVNPDMPEHLRIAMIVIPCILTIIFALNFSSALAIFWSTSNCFTALQTAALHFLIRHRMKLGTLKF